MSRKYPPKDPGSLSFLEDTVPNRGYIATSIIDTKDLIGTPQTCLSDDDGRQASLVPRPRESDSYFPVPTVVAKLYLFQADVVYPFFCKEIGHVLLGQLRRLFHIHGRLPSCFLSG